MRLVFCTVSCWDSHVAMLRHRDAWAVEERAPSKEQWDAELAENPAPVAAQSSNPKSAPIPAVRRAVEAPQPLSPTGDGDVLIVVSKVKKYIKDRSGMNCGDAVADVLSEHVRAVCDEAIRAAGRDERKTVLERDVPRPQRR